MITIIIPTIGRATLERTLFSIRPHRTTVEVIVVSDGKQKSSKKITKKANKILPFKIQFIKGPKTRNYGNTQRNIGIEHASGSHIMFIDDDDIYTPDAFFYIDKAIKKFPNNPIVFRMLDHNFNRYILWRRRGPILGNIGTPMVCLPNNTNRLAEWQNIDDYGSDADFIYHTLTKYKKKQIKWFKDCIVITRPEV